MKSNSNRMYRWASALLITALAVGCDESKEANETESAESAFDGDRTASGQTMWCRNWGKEKGKPQQWSYEADFIVTDEAIALDVKKGGNQGAVVRTPVLYRFNDDLEFATENNVYRATIRNVSVNGKQEPRMIVEDWEHGVVTTTSTGFCATDWLQCDPGYQIECKPGARCECDLIDE